LSDRIRDLVDLTILYPNKPKGEAFDKYIVPRAIQPRRGDYIPAGIRATMNIDRNRNMMQFNSPGSFMSSPDQNSRDSPSVHSEASFATNDEHFVNPLPSMQLLNGFPLEAFDSETWSWDADPANNPVSYNGE